MKSKLATIQKIKKIVKHPNADRLNIISVLGWQCITAEKYSEGDLCIYIPVDTTVPKTEWSDFLFKGDEERARIKSIKLRGEISQGLILPPSVLRGEHFFNLHKDENGEWLYRVMNGYNALYEGQDVTDELGIMKYEKPIPASLAGEVVGDFPTHLCPKTDEERCLSEETIVLTEDGPKTIKELCESEYCGKILSYNIETKQNEYKNMTGFQINPQSDDWVEIELENGLKIKATENHRVWVDNLSCYRMVKDLDGSEELVIKTE